MILIINARTMPKKPKETVVFLTKMRYNLSMKRIVLTVGVLLLMGGCRPLWLQVVDPPGPPEYQLGWEDGCDSGLSAEGGWDYKVMYGFKKRPEMSSNDQYKQGWNEGFTYCRYSLDTSQTAGRWEDIGLGNGL